MTLLQKNVKTLKTIQMAKNAQKDSKILTMEVQYFQIVKILLRLLQSINQILAYHSMTLLQKNVKTLKTIQMAKNAQKDSKISTMEVQYFRTVKILHKLLQSINQILLCHSMTLLLKNAKTLKTMQMVKNAPRDCKISTMEALYFQTVKIFLKLHLSINQILAYHLMTLLLKNVKILKTILMGGNVPRDYKITTMEVLYTQTVKILLKLLRKQILAYHSVMLLLENVKTL
jgi:predicted phosphatase